jgi:hypothetical protein
MREHPLMLRRNRLVPEPVDRRFGGLYTDIDAMDLFQHVVIGSAQPGLRVA